MESLLLGVAVLACPVGMGVMMWMMGRGQRNGAVGTTAGTTASSDKAGAGGGGGVEGQVVALRAEIDQLKADRAAQRAKGGR